MIKEPLYHKTIGILVDAYFDDTLQHGNCSACAVGNLVAAAKGCTPNELRPHWQSIHFVMETTNGYFFKTKSLFTNPEIGLNQLRSTGYTEFETAEIEWAFETAPKGNSEDEWMFNGLMAVIDCLDKIHQVNDVNVSEASKKRFVKVLN
jgi:hypothetical protein